MNLKTFYIDQNIEYQELFLNSKIIQKCYLLRNRGHDPFITIPDGCVDIQFLFGAGSSRACISSSVEQPHISYNADRDWIFGVKLNPGIFPNAVHRENQMLDKHFSLEEEMEVEKILTSLEREDNLENMAEIVEHIIANISYTEQNPLITYPMKQIEEEKGCINLADLSEQMHYSQHYVNQKFKKATGFTLKKYAEIIRLQCAITYLEKQKTDLIYEILGYYDQAHFIKDFKRFTLQTPKKCIKKRNEIRFA